MFDKFYDYGIIFIDKMLNKFYELLMYLFIILKMIKI